MDIEETFHAQNSIRYHCMDASRNKHNTFIPFFLGLILGDFTIGSIWAIVGPIMGVQAYKIYI